MASTVVERYKAWDRDEVDAILEARRIRPPGEGRQQMMYGHKHHSEREVQLWEEHKEDDDEESGAVHAVGKGKDEIVRRRKSAPHALHTNVRLKDREAAAAAAAEEEEDDEPSVHQQQQSRARASLCIPRISRRKSNTFDLCELRSPTPHRRSVSQPLQHDLVRTSPPLHSNLQKMKMTNPWL